MDFELSEELAQLQATVRRLAQEKIKPRAREIDSSSEYPLDVFEAFKDAGLLGLCIPEEYGGAGAGILGLTLAIEEVTKYSNVTGLMLLLTRLPTGPIMIAGTEDQKQRYLPGIAEGVTRCGFGLSEPQAGSDLAMVRTRLPPLFEAVAAASGGGGLACLLLDNVAAYHTTYRCHLAARAGFCPAR